MNLDILRDNILKNIDSLNEKILIYQSRIKKQRHHYDKACQISKEEIYNDVKQLISLIKKSEGIDIPLEILTLGKDLIGSSVWVLHRYLAYLKSFLQFSIKSEIIDNRKHQKMLEALQNNTPIEKTGFSPQEIFQCIFQDLLLEDKDHCYVTPLQFPKIKATIVLASGVLNELYRMATFERAVTHLQEQFNIEYLALKVHGRRGSTHNAKLIERQLKEYINQNPEKKFWILAHSKGGIDSLHFLRRNPEFASKYVLGISTIATPIMGSPHTDHIFVRILQLLVKLEDTTIYQKIDRGRNLLLKNVPYYLSENFQKRWFERNVDYLPKKYLLLISGTSK